MAILLSRQIKDESYDKCRWSRASSGSGSNSYGVIACHFSSASFDNRQLARKGGSDAGRSRQSTADNRQATSGCCRHICEAVMAARQACARCLSPPSPLCPPEWLLIKNKHDFCFAFIFYYKPGSPAPTRPALPSTSPISISSFPGLLEKR